MFLKTLKKATASGLVAALLMTVSTTGASASVINTAHPNFVFDTFNSAFVTPNPANQIGYWWRTLVSTDASGNTNRAENVDCNFSECVKKMSENGTNFARLSQSPEPIPGKFNLAEISEEKDGFTYGLTHRWLPTEHKPVVMTSRFKFSDGYKGDGTGNAVGSAGLWLWNAPVDIPNGIGEVHNDNYFAFGFNWTDSQTFGGFFKGLKATVIDKNVAAPSYSVDLSTVNMNAWNIGTVIWSVDHSGVQSLKSLLNGQEVGNTTLAIPMPTMTVEVWADNQSAQIGPTGLFINYPNPSVEQHMDVDFLNVAQP